MITLGMEEAESQGKEEQGLEKICLLHDIA